MQAHEHEHPREQWRAPLTWKCKGKRAYLATSLAFSSPTPERLGRALAGATTGAALVMYEQGEDFLVALSATERRASKREAFPSEAVPTFMRLIDGFGDPPGVSSERFQTRGYLRVVDGQKTSWLEIENINWRAVEKGDCGEISVDAYARVPSSQWGLSLRTSAGLQSLQALSDLPSAPPQGPAREYPLTLHFSFKATPVTAEYPPPRDLP